MFRSLANILLQIQYPSESSGEWFFYIKAALDMIRGARLEEQLGKQDIVDLVDWVHYHNAVSQFTMRHWRYKCVVMDPSNASEEAPCYLFTQFRSVGWLAIFTQSSIRSHIFTGSTLSKPRARDPELALRGMRDIDRPIRPQKQGRGIPKSTPSAGAKGQGPFDFRPSQFSKV